jgi:hypothetical protein
MKQIAIFLLSLFLVLACKKQAVPVDKVIYGLQISNTSPLADGTTILNISVFIDSLADSDEKNVIFTCSSGSFLPSKDTTMTQAANYINGQLVAAVQFQVPFTPGTVYIRAIPANQNQFVNYQILDSISILPSYPATLTLLPSLLGIKSGFGNEITLTATLKNSAGNDVSTGEMVLFEQYIINNSPDTGAFRTQRDTTDITSTATASYTAGNIPAGSTVYLRATYIDPFGNPSTTIKDTCVIRVTN